MKIFNLLKALMFINGYLFSKTSVAAVFETA